MEDFNIKILGQNWPVKFIPDFGHSSDTVGRNDPISHEINIKKGMAQEANYETILHEITHGIFNNAGLGKTDEGSIEAISNNFFCCLRENKEFFIDLINGK